MPWLSASERTRGSSRPVRTGPGLTATTRTPSATPLSASALVSESRAALTEPPTVNSAPGVRPPTPTTLTIVPRRSASSGHAARAARTAA